MVGSGAYGQSETDLKAGSVITILLCFLITIFSGSFSFVTSELFIFYYKSIPEVKGESYFTVIFLIFCSARGLSE